MRRKSSRNVSKAPEKTTEPTTRRSRRHSKRRKRSSSRSSSEENSNEVDIKTTKQKPTEVGENSKSEEKPSEEEPVWTVTPSETSSGDIQKLKISLTKSTPSPTRRRRKKSESHADDDVTSPDEKTPRKLRLRGSAEEEQEEEQQPQPEELEDKKGKGKSKTKHRSKSEKTPKIQEVEEQTQSDISENAQVTPQSPQAAIGIEVDNVSPTENETVGSNDETNSVPQSTNASDSTNENVGVEKVETDDANETSQSKHSDNPKEHEEDSPDSNFKVNEQSRAKLQESVVKEKSPAAHEKVEKEEKVQEEKVEEEKMDVDESGGVTPPVVDNDNNKNQDSINKVQTNEVVDKMETTEEEPKSEQQEEQQQQQEAVLEENTEAKQENEMKADDAQTEEINEPLQKDEQPKSPPLRSELESSASDEIEPTEEANKTEEDNKITTMEESQKSDEDSRSADVIEIDIGSTSNKEDTSFNLSQSFSPDIRQMVEENKQLQPLKDEVHTLFETPSKMQRKRRWGNTLVGLELVKSHLTIIDVEAIKQFCPDLQFLEEGELKMDIHEAKDTRRKSVTDVREKRSSDRKVSVDYKLNTAGKSYELQGSVNSSEMEEEVHEQEIDYSSIIAMNRKISIVDDTASKLKPPPSPAKNPVSEVLFITNLVRPFTLKQLKELLERTGKIRENGFWTDRIKSKCYVYYETTDEAEATRNALHGVNWPIGNGKKLIIDYATPDDLEKAKNPTPPTPPPTVVAPELKYPEKESQVLVKKHKPEEIEKPVKEHERHRNETHVREWDIGKEDLHRVRSRSRERNDRSGDKRKHRRTPSPEEDFISRKQRKKEEDIPQKLMDDLFCKTKSTPSIYWLPLTPEQIATKQQQRLLRMAEHKRRLEETSRSRVDYGRGAPYRRRYD